MLFSLLLLVILLLLLAVLLDAGELLSDVHVTSLYLLHHCLVHLGHLSQVNCAWSLMQKSGSFDKGWPHISLCCSQQEITYSKSLINTFRCLLKNTIYIFKHHRSDSLNIPCWRFPISIWSQTYWGHFSFLWHFETYIGNSSANIALGMGTDWWLCHCLSESSKHY